MRIEGSLMISFSSSQPATNGTGTILYQVSGTDITLSITPIPNQPISRSDLITTLYDRREYLSVHIKQQGNSRLQAADDPFSSTKIPNPPQGNCMFEAKSDGKPKGFSYKFLGDALQGLMDYTFYPYSQSVDSLDFEVFHHVWGRLGSGSLTATQHLSTANAK